MTTINFRPDDAGLQRLKAENEAPGTAKAVTPVAPSAATATSQAESTEERNAPRKRPPGERRRGERRRQDQPVLLDTRSKRERRRGPQPAPGTGAADGGEAPESGPGGIDVYT